LNQELRNAIAASVNLAKSKIDAPIIQSNGVASSAQGKIE
jgi:hypothetical protein